MIAQQSQERISLRGGWSGLIPGGSDQWSPTTSEWKVFLDQLIADPESLLNRRVLKYSNQGEVFDTRIEGQSKSIRVVCKQSRSKSLGPRIARMIRGSRERRNFLAACRLIEAGLQTARPLALIEKRGLARSSWLVTEYVADLVDLDQVALQLLPQSDSSRRRRIKDGLSAALVSFFHRLEELRMPHRDLKASNILLRNWDGVGDTPNVWLVDLDGLGRRGTLTPTRARSQLVRLAASLLDYTSLTRTDFLRFFRSYNSNRKATPDWKNEFRMLANEALQYRKRSGKRKSHKLDGYEA